MSITNSLRYCGDVEYKYNRGYGGTRIGRYATDYRYGDDYSEVEVNALNDAIICYE
jgi:hypothetical protein